MNQVDLIKYLKSHDLIARVGNHETLESAKALEQRGIVKHIGDDDEGTPLFSDGTIGLFSFRAWGDLMAAISQSVDGKPRSYMSWYYIYTDIPTPPTDETPTSEGEKE